MPANDIQSARTTPLQAFASIAIGCALLASATWLGHNLNAARSDTAEQALRVVDTERAIVFDANPATGEVRVLNVRSGISEIARLYDARSQGISKLSLDAQNQILTVTTPGARYEYDTRTLHLLSPNTQVAL